MTYNITWSDQTFGSFISQIGIQTGYFDMLLFVEFLLIILVGTIANKKSTGFSNIIDWALLSGFVTTLSAIMLFMGNFIEMPSLIICAIITISVVIAEILAKMVDSKTGI